MSFAKRDILIMNQKVLLLVGVVALTYIGLFRITGSEVRSETEIDITRGTVEPSPIAVTNFHAVDPSAEILGAEISAVIAANLEVQVFSVRLINVPFSKNLRSFSKFQGLWTGGKLMLNFLCPAWLRLDQII